MLFCSEDTFLGSISEPAIVYGNCIWVVAQLHPNPLFTPASTSFPCPSVARCARFFVKNGNVWSRQPHWTDGACLWPAISITRKRLGQQNKILATGDRDWNINTRQPNPAWHRQFTFRWTLRADNDSVRHEGRNEEWSCSCRFTAYACVIKAKPRSKPSEHCVRTSCGAHSIITISRKKIRPLLQRLANEHAERSIYTSLSLVDSVVKSRIYLTSFWRLNKTTIWHFHKPASL